MSTPRSMSLASCATRAEAQQRVGAFVDDIQQARLRELAAAWLRDGIDVEEMAALIAMEMTDLAHCRADVMEQAGRIFDAMESGGMNNG